MPKKSEIKRVAIFNHHQGDTTDATQPLLDYLLASGTNYLVNIRFPFLKSKEGEIETRIFSRDRKIIKKSLIRFYKPVLLSYLKDLLYSFFYGFRYCKNIDIFFGSPNLLVLSGILLKKIGFVKKVVYYIIDYTPQKYGNSLINSLYFSIDKFVCYNVDEVWSLNRSMIDSRIRDKRWNKSRINTRIVPFGNNGFRFSLKDFKNNDKNTIVYFGGISKDKGAELFVPIATNLMKLGKKNFKFLVIGGGNTEWLKTEVKMAKLSKYFEITGPIQNHNVIEDWLVKCGVALAPYYPEDKNNFSYYSDPGKVKTYLGCGLPVVITDVPPIAQELVQKNAGVIVRYDPKDIAVNIMKIISDNNYQKIRGNAIRLGRRFWWGKIFQHAFS